MTNVIEKNKEFLSPEEYSITDLLAVAAAREVNDGEVVFAGTGLPMLAIALAKLTTAPTSKLIYEAGTIDSWGTVLPSSVGDARCVTQCSVASGLFDVFNQLQRGSIDLAYLGGAEIDKYGNVNTTVHGDYLNPDFRFPGSGGNSDINSLAKRTVFLMVQEKRRFKEKVDYITSPGWRFMDYTTGKWTSRQEAYGKKFLGGPTSVISNMAVFRFDEKTGEMYVDTIHPGITKEQLQDNCGFQLDFSHLKGETAPPTAKEIDLLYNNVDTDGIFLQKKK